MEGIGEGLDRASHVKKVELILQSDEHIDGLVGHCRSLVCTHLAGIGMVGYSRWPCVELIVLMN